MSSNNMQIGIGLPKMHMARASLQDWERGPAEEVAQLETSVGQTAADRYPEAALRFISRD